MEIGKMKRILMAATAAAFMPFSDEVIQSIRPDKSLEFDPVRNRVWKIPKRYKFTDSVFGSPAKVSLAKLHSKRKGFHYYE